MGFFVNLGEETALLAGFCYASYNTKVMPHVFFIPGFRENAQTKPYRALSQLFSRQGLKPHIIVPHWNRRTMSDYVAEIEGILPRTTSKDYLLGFSFGAYLSLILSTRQKFRHQFLCSVSPYFREDLAVIPQTWKRIIGKRRVEDFAQYRRRWLAPRIQCPTTMYVGGKEGTIMNRVTPEIFRQITKPKKLHVIAGCRHNIRDSRYIKQITNDTERIT